jgi:lipopolysaccharide transport system permease protein
VTLLDGDLVRKNLSSELGFSKEHRDINIRRIGFVASEITKNGGIAHLRPDRPLRRGRKEVREMIEPSGGFVLVHVSTPLEVCERATARASTPRPGAGISDPSRSSPASPTPTRSRTTMVVFSVVFGRLAGIPSDGVPYPVFAYAALVPWALFADGFSQAATSLVANGNLVRKVYFPRLVLPLAGVLTSLIDFAPAFAVLLAMMLFYGIAPTTGAVWLPALLLLALVSALGVGLWLAAIAVRFRDVRHAVPFLRQLWLFATPIAYPASLLDEPWRTIYGLNPMAGVVEGFRRTLLGTETAAGPMVLVSAGVAVVLLVSGAYFFRRTERQMADLL